MKFPVLTKLNAPSASSTLYGSIQSNYQTSFDATLSNSEQVAAADGQFDNWYVNLASAPTAGKSFVFTLVKNGSDTAATITIADAATTGSYTGTITFSAGDRLAVKSVPSGTPTAGVYSHGFAAQATNQILFSGMSGTLNNAAARYYGLMASAIYTSTTALANVIPTDGVIKNLRVNGANSPGVGKSYTFTLVKNGVDTALVATLSGTNTTASDLSDTVSVSAGDTAYWRVDPSGTPTAFRASIGAEFAPTINGESIQIINAGGSLGAAGGNNFMGTVSSSGASWSTSESARSMYAPNETYTLKKLYASVDTQPGSGKSWTITVRDNASNTAVTTSIANTNTTANDTSNSATSTANALLGINVVGVSTPSAAVGSFSFVTYSVPTNNHNALLLTGVG